MSNLLNKCIDDIDIEELFRRQLPGPCHHHDIANETSGLLTIPKIALNSQTSRNPIQASLCHTPLVRTILRLSSRFLKRGISTYPSSLSTPDRGAAPGVEARAKRGDIRVGEGVGRREVEEAKRCGSVMRIGTDGAGRRSVVDVGVRSGGEMGVGDVGRRRANGSE